MEADESERQQAGKLDLAVEENPLVRHEDVVKDRQRLHHLVPRANRMLERVLGRSAVRARDQLEPRRVDRHREGERVGLVLGAHRARRQHDYLIGVGRDRRMHLGAAHDHAVRALLDHAHVVVQMVLRRRTERAVALDVGLGDGDREVVVAAIAIVLLDPIAVDRFAGRREPLADDLERQQRVGANLLDQHDQRRALAGRRRD